MRACVACPPKSSQKCLALEEDMLWPCYPYHNPWHWQKINQMYKHDTQEGNMVPCGTQTWHWIITNFQDDFPIKTHVSPGSPGQPARHMVPTPMGLSLLAAFEELDPQSSGGSNHLWNILVRRWYGDRGTIPGSWNKVHKKKWLCECM